MVAPVVVIANPSRPRAAHLRLPALRGWALALACLAASPARAVVGGAPEPAAGAQSVMLLGSRGGACSAVLVASDALLTAAHCVAGVREHRVHWRGPGGEPVLVEPAEVAIHPGHDPRAVEARRRSIDLALVRLAQPLPAPFRPAALSAAPPLRAGEPVAVGGYGKVAERDPKSGGVFHAAALTVTEPHGPPSILLWASSAEGRPVGACGGDSGGPMRDAGGRVVALLVWSTGPGRARCGALSQGLLLAPQRAFIDRVLGTWGREARWLP